MTDDPKPVPEPGEANRDQDDVHYFETDETNVSGTEGEEQPEPDEDDA